MITRRVRVERVCLGALILALMGVGLGFSYWIKRASRAMEAMHWVEQPNMVVPPLELNERVAALRASLLQFALSIDEEQQSCFSSEWRVAAIGSAYPIRYEAIVCPFSGIPQPALNQMDRDGDSMTDEWEIKHGLNRNDPRDAHLDPDNDGFSNLEEFMAGTDPNDPASHPPYILKCRLLTVRTKPFPLMFSGAIELPDGGRMYQLNEVATGASRFVGLGERVQGVELVRFEAGERSDRDDYLVVRRDGVEIVLPIGAEVTDPENEAELINILDHSSRIVTMGALLSIQSEIYTVITIDTDKLVVRLEEDGELFEVVGFSDEERRRNSEGFEVEGD
jgi:hypothetical protein